MIRLVDRHCARWITGKMWAIGDSDLGRQLGWRTMLERTRTSIALDEEKMHKITVNLTKEVGFWR